MVLPEIERPEEWEAHLTGTLASLAPVGHLETILAERVALLLWRMHRVARFEREMIAVGQERVVEDYVEQRRLSFRLDPALPTQPDDLRAALRDAQLSLKIVAVIYLQPDDEPVSGEDAEAVLSVIAEQATEADPEVFSMPDVVPDEVPWSQFEDWTAGRVRRGVEAMAEAEGEGVTMVDLFLAALQAGQARVVKLKTELERTQTALSQMRRERLLASTPQTDRVTRYEAHLSRQLSLALHELQRLQAARVGDPVGPPVVVDVAVTDEQ